MNLHVIHVREAVKEDATLIADLSRSTFRESWAEDMKENIEKFFREQFTQQALIEEVGSPGNIFFIAIINQVPVGYVRLRRSEGPSELNAASPIEIARLYAAKEYIGKGVGSALMKRSLELAKANNHDFIWLSTWEKNQRGIDFYLRWGFEKFSEQDFMLGNDLQRDWLMRKKTGDELVIP